MSPAALRFKFYDLLDAAKAALRDGDPTKAEVLLTQAMVLLLNEPRECPA